MLAHYITFPPVADPYLAADDFLNANELPSYYLDQVGPAMLIISHVCSGYFDIHVHVLGIVSPYARIAQC